MASPTARIAGLEPAKTSSAHWPAVAADYWALTKPEINFLIGIATLTGFCLGYPAEPNGFPLVLMIHTLAATLLVSAGAAALNQYVERHFDARMRRTRRRPLADGRMEPGSALGVGVLLAVAGSIYLAVAVNVLSSLLAIAALVGYLAIYTPLKRRTPFCTMVGAVSGALPPLIGWAAATNQLNSQAWMLFGILFLWQFPHFMAIAWIYREDYARAGYAILPVGSSRERFMSWQALAPALALMPISARAAVLNGSGPLGVSAVCVLTSVFIFYSAHLAFRKSNVAARRLLMASIAYLPATYCLLMLDRF